MVRAHIRTLSGHQASESQKSPRSINHLSARDSHLYQFVAGFSRENRVRRLICARNWESASTVGPKEHNGQKGELIVPDSAAGAPGQGLQDASPSSRPSLLFHREAFPLSAAHTSTIPSARERLLSQAPLPMEQVNRVLNYSTTKKASINSSSALCRDQVCQAPVRVQFSGKPSAWGIVICVCTGKCDMSRACHCQQGGCPIDL